MTDRRAARVVTTILAVLVPLLTACVVYLVIQNSSQDTRIATNASQATTALCALRTDVQLRVQQSADFLKRNPHGIPGISAAQIASTIDSQTRTIKALAVLDC